MRPYPVAIILLLVSASLAGCLDDEAKSNNDADDTVENIDGAINVPA